uniref:Putative exonuclease n=1 Tax=viral metagenome TaxID=1070528 RepID=A0A6M3LQL9_9ZZZZ
MIRLDVKQGSEEWFAARRGIPTSSEFGRIIGVTGKISTAKSYLYELAGARITGVDKGNFQSAAMARGTEMEPEARAYCELVMGVEVEQVGFILDDSKRYGCSPDGLFGDTGLEAKCPSVHVHIGYLLAGVLPSDYFAQVQGSMLVTGFSHWWFCSYFPGLPALILDVQRDWEFTAKLSVALKDFCNELNELEKKLRRLA